MKLIKMLPFLSSSELEKLFEKIKNSENLEYEGLKLHYLFPFLEEKIIESYFDELLEKGYSTKLIYPFISDSKIDELFLKALSGELKLNFIEILPFVSNQLIDDEFMKRLENNEDFLPLLPFISREILTKIVDSYLAGNENINMDHIYPFLSEEDIKRLFDHIIKEERN